MTYYTATIASDGNDRQLIVHWDDDDPNRHITAPRFLPGSATEADLAKELARDRWRLVSTDSDNLGRGWAIVARNSEHGVYDPIGESWHTILTDSQKAAIAAKYPDASVPGSSR